MRPAVVVVVQPSNDRPAGLSTGGDPQPDAPALDYPSGIDVVHVAHRQAVLEVMAKCLTVQLLLDRLDLPGHGWMAVDHWSGDDHAVGIARDGTPRRLVYVSTFAKGLDRYAYECEVPSGPGDTDYAVVGCSDDVSYDELRHVVEVHVGESS